MILLRKVLLLVLLLALPLSRTKAVLPIRLPQSPREEDRRREAQKAPLPRRLKPALSMILLRIVDNFVNIWRCAESCCFLWDFEHGH